MRNVFRQGDHICALYDGEDDRIAIAAEYVVDGLRHGERCYYVADSPEAIERLRVALRQAGVDVDALVRRGSLVEATHAEAHLVDGRFDSERMMRLLNEAVESALRDGFSGLRTCGDMSWLLDNPPGAEQIVQYEAFLNGFFSGLPAQGMCQYDRRRLPPNLIDDAVATHASMIFERQHVANHRHQPIAATRAPSELG